MLHLSGRWGLSTNVVFRQSLVAIMRRILAEFPANFITGHLIVVSLIHRPQHCTATDRNIETRSRCSSVPTLVEFRSQCLKPRIWSTCELTSSCMSISGNTQVGLSNQVAISKVRHKVEPMITDEFGRLCEVGILLSEVYRWPETWIVCRLRPRSDHLSRVGRYISLWVPAESSELHSVFVCH